MTPPKKIAVFYLARCAEGTQAIREFVESYRKFEAGLDHDLVIIFKGYTSRKKQRLAEKEFEGLNYLAIELVDEGFDLGSYHKAARKVSHEYILCLNTFSQILTDHWLKKFYSLIVTPSVGLVGATGSYQSIHSWMVLLQKTLFLSNYHFLNTKIRKSIVKYFHFMIPSERTNKSSYFHRCICFLNSHQVSRRILTFLGIADATFVSPTSFDNSILKTSSTIKTSSDNKLDQNNLDTQSHGFVESNAQGNTENFNSTLSTLPLSFTQKVKRFVKKDQIAKRLVLFFINRLRRLLENMWNHLHSFIKSVIIFNRIFLKYIVSFVYIISFFIIKYSSFYLFYRFFCERKYQKWWNYAKSLGDIANFCKFPEFPNPHIRTNAFMINRKLFIDLRKPVFNKKINACFFESGINSMTRQILASGLKVKVVGSNGEGYDIDNWFQSHTFRSGNQKNLIISDNQTRNYHKVSSEEKLVLELTTWGEEKIQLPDDFPRLKIFFKNSPTSRDFSNLTRKESLSV